MASGKLDQFSLQTEGLFGYKATQLLSCSGVKELKMSMVKNFFRPFRPARRARQKPIITAPHSAAALALKRDCGRDARAEQRHDGRSFLFYYPDSKIQLPRRSPFTRDVVLLFAWAYSLVK
ncbi:hypothetical protein EVAR_55904_1 [Eumeta japonica]|uniref:Uncharacterized protein n=1 Tax=Eumeta variegata TaxID=151549 RepID=A0A4C1YNM9_EUMVA|nr:hypothetical protein EVAR_55904_1 [Eumeta japonica]